MNRRIAAIAGVAAAAALITLFLVARDSDNPGRVNVLDLEVTTRVGVGEAPQAVATTAGKVYVANLAEASVSAVDVVSNEVVDDFQVGALPAAMVGTRPGRLWVGFAEGEYIAQFDDSGRVIGDALKVGNTPQGMAVAGDNLWVTALNAGTVARVDLATDRLEGRPARVGSDFPSSVAVGFGSLWVTDVVENTLLRVDPESLRRDEVIEVGDSPTAVVVGHGSVWVANFRDGTVSRVDPDSNEVVAVITVGKGIGGMSVGETYVWVTTHEHGSVAAIDPRGDGVAGVERVGRRPQGIVATEDGAWVAVQGTNEVVRVEPAGS
jgi:DNA-binding beta-propeller fold protein YncE